MNAWRTVCVLICLLFVFGCNNKPDIPNPDPDRFEIASRALFYQDHAYYRILVVKDRKTNREFMLVSGDCKAVAEIK